MAQLQKVDRAVEGWLDKQTTPKLERAMTDADLKKQKTSSLQVEEVSPLSMPPKGTSFRLRPLDSPASPGPRLLPKVGFEATFSSQQEKQQEKPIVRVQKQDEIVEIPADSAPTVDTLVTGVSVHLDNAVATGYAMGTIELVFQSILIAGATIFQNRTSLHALIAVYAVHFCVLFVLRARQFYTWHLHHYLCDW